MPECRTDQDPCDVTPRAGEAWSVCLPWGGRIWADDNGVHATGGVAPPDGVYGKVVIANGCLVGVQPEDVPLYTGSPCAPMPGDCGSATAAAAATYAAPRAMSYAAATEYVGCAIKAGASVEISGSGTDDDPYVISADPGVYALSDSAAITVSGSGSRVLPLRIGHVESPAGGMTRQGFVFDKYGHLTGAVESNARNIMGLVPTEPVTVSTDNATGIATLGLRQPPYEVSGPYQLGGYKITLDQFGRVVETGQTIDLQGLHDVQCGTQQLTVNDTGSVVDVKEITSYGTCFCMASAATSVDLRLRGATGLAGEFYTTSELVKIFIDGTECDSTHIDKHVSFWGNGIYMPGEHTVAIMQDEAAIRSAVFIWAATMLETGA